MPALKLKLEFYLPPNLPRPQDDQWEQEASSQSDELSADELGTEDRLLVFRTYMHPPKTILCN